MATYKIVRRYFSASIRKKVLRTGLSLQEAQKHCSDPETSSSTCTNAVGKNRTKKVGPWFDSYQEE